MAESAFQQDAFQQDAFQTEAAAVQTAPKYFFELSKRMGFTENRRPDLFTVSARKPYSVTRRPEIFDVLDERPAFALVAAGFRLREYRPAFSEKRRPDSFVMPMRETYLITRRTELFNVPERTAFTMGAAE